MVTVGSGASFLVTGEDLRPNSKLTRHTAASTENTVCGDVCTYAYGGMSYCYSMYMYTYPR